MQSRAPKLLSFIRNKRSEKNKKCVYSDNDVVELSNVSL